MTRLTLTLATLMSLVSVAPASLASRKESPVASEVLLTTSAKQPVEQAAGQRTEPEFVLTNRTEVLLNGKPWRYEDIPAHASIMRMEVAADRKTVLKVYFRSGK